MRLLVVVSAERLVVKKMLRLGHTCIFQTRLFGFLERNLAWVGGHSLPTRIFQCFNSNAAARGRKHTLSDLESGFRLQSSCTCINSFRRKCLNWLFSGQTPNVVPFDHLPDAVLRHLDRDERCQCQCQPKGTLCAGDVTDDVVPHQNKNVKTHVVPNKSLNV